MAAFRSGSEPFYRTDQWVIHNYLNAAHLARTWPRYDPVGGLLEQVTRIGRAGGATPTIYQHFAEGNLGVHRSRIRPHAPSTPEPR